MTACSPIYYCEVGRKWGMDARLRAHTSSNGVTRNGRLSQDRLPGLSSKGDLFGKSGRSFNFELRMGAESFWTKRLD